MRRPQETKKYFFKISLPPIWFILCSILLSLCDMSFHWENLADYNIWINNFIFQFSFLGLLALIMEKIDFFKKNPIANLSFSYFVSTVLTTGISWKFSFNFNISKIVSTIIFSVIIGFLIFVWIFVNNRKKFDNINNYFTVNAKKSVENFQKLSKKEQYDFEQIVKKLSKNQKLFDQMVIYISAIGNDTISFYEMFKKK